MKIIIVGLFFLISVVAKSQEIINDFEINDFEIGDVRYFDTYTNGKDSSLVSIFLNKKDLYAYNYDLASSSIGKPLVYENLKTKYGIIVGHASQNNRHTSFFNYRNEKWHYLSLDFNNQEVSLEQYDFRLKSEVILNSFSTNDSHYILTIKKTLRYFSYIN